MSGWKTWAAGIGMILAGIAQGLMSISGQGEGDITSAIQTVTAGLAVIGIGHKIDKAA